MCDLTKIHKLTREKHDKIVKVAHKETQQGPEENTNQNNKMHSNEMKLTGFKHCNTAKKHLKTWHQCICWCNNHTKESCSVRRTVQEAKKKQSLSVVAPHLTRSVAQCHSTDAEFLPHFTPRETLFRFNLFVSHKSTNSVLLCETNRLKRNSDSLGMKCTRSQQIETHVLRLFVKFRK